VKKIYIQQCVENVIKVSYRNKLLKNDLYIIVYTYKTMEGIINNVCERKKRKKYKNDSKKSDLIEIQKKVISYIQDMMLFDKAYQDDDYIYIREICNYLEKNPSKLKSSLLEFEEILYGPNNNYINNNTKVIWNFLKKYRWLEIYNKIDEDNYESLFEIFLCMIHNIPIIPPYCDNTVSGCYYFDNTLIKRYQENNYHLQSAYTCILFFINTEKTINTNSLLKNNILKYIKPISKYMKIQDWINKYE